MSLRDAYDRSMRLGLTQFTPYSAEYNSVYDRAIELQYGQGMFNPEYDYQRGLPDYLRNAPGRLSPDGMATTNALIRGNGIFDPTTGIVAADPFAKAPPQCLSCQNLPATTPTKDPAAPILVVGGSSGGSGQVIQTVTGAANTTTATSATGQATTTGQPAAEIQTTQAQELNLFGLKIDKKYLPWIVGGGALLVVAVATSGGKK
jgi:hypothetical protein